MVIIWILLYGVIYLISNFLSKSIGIQYIITAPALLAFTIMLIFIIKQSKYDDMIKIKKFDFKVFDLFYIVPLFCFSLVNIIFVDYKFNILSIILMLSTCAMEEIIFRGYLLSYFNKINHKLSAYICTLIFAFYHLFNVFASYNLLFILTQFICAISVGLSYSAITEKFDSIIIPFIIHFVTNITAIGNIESYSFAYYICLSICFIINIGCFIFLKLDFKKSQIESDSANQEN